jgi:hypothetical protein
MLTLPLERSVRIPFCVGLFMVALGFFFFESYGAFLGGFEDKIVVWQLQQIKAHPEIKQTVEGKSATPEEAADKAWERIKFVHGHGYLMVLAAFALLMLIANVSIMAARTKAVLMWVSLVAMVLYNVGWALAGWLVPYLGAEEAKEIGEMFFFVPLGLTIVAITGFTAVAYGREALAYIKRPSTA